MRIVESIITQAGGRPCSFPRYTDTSSGLPDLYCDHHISKWVVAGAPSMPPASCGPSSASPKSAIGAYLRLLYGDGSERSWPRTVEEARDSLPFVYDLERVSCTQDFIRTCYPEALACRNIFHKLSGEEVRAGKSVALNQLFFPGCPS